MRLGGEMEIDAGYVNPHVLDALGESIIADQAFPFLHLRVVKPVNTFVDEATEDFHADEIRDSGTASGGWVTEQTAHEVECWQGGW